MFDAAILELSCARLAQAIRGKKVSAVKAMEAAGAIQFGVLNMAR